MTAAISRRIVDWYKQTYPEGGQDIEEWCEKNEIMIVGEKDGDYNQN